MKGRKLLVGIGSPYGQDCLGWLVTKEVAARGLAEWECRLAPAPSAILNWLPGHAELHLCDAYVSVASGQMERHGPRTMQRWLWPNVPASWSSCSGTHDLSLIATLNLANELQLLTCPVIIWGVECFATDLPLSNDEAGIRQWADQICEWSETN